MNHLEVITSNKTWVCPRSGVYKIIAVGGGSSSSFNLIRDDSVDVYKHLYKSGGDTTFGDKLTATGGAGQLESTYIQAALVGGAGGYTLQSYGGEGGLTSRTYNGIPPTVNGGFPGKTGRGYGAGGANSALLPNSINMGTGPYMQIGIGCSGAGELSELICDLDANESYSCVIGQGSGLTASDISSVVKELYSLGDSEYSALTDVVDMVSDMARFDHKGNNGCIVIEYLGESY